MRSGQIEAGLAAAQELVKRESTLAGEKHFSTAAARGSSTAVGFHAGRQQDGRSSRVQDGYSRFDGSGA